MYYTQWIMPQLSTAELRQIERQYADGIKSAAIIEIFQSKGHRFSEATLRKYVQLGLLPRSRRVGLRGRNRGSSGLYPVCIVRLVNEIKAALDRGATLEQVRLGVGLSSELQTLVVCGGSVMSRFDEAIEHVSDRKQRATLKQLAERERRAFRKLAQDLEILSTRLRGSQSSNGSMGREGRNSERGGSPTV